MKLIKYYCRTCVMLLLRMFWPLYEFFRVSRKAVLSPRKEGNLAYKGLRVNLAPSTYWLTRIVFLRCLGLLYFVAFMVAADQSQKLFGENGLTPANKYLRRSREKLGDSVFRAFLVEPSFAFFSISKLDTLLIIFMYLGLALSGFVLLYGCANMIIVTFLWFTYLSFVNAGRQWYSFGWESLLLETGFVAIFLCPVYKMRQVPVQSPPSLVVVWAYRWFILRMAIQGLMKMRNSHCWQTRTCMNYKYQYETQPVPTLMSYYMYQSSDGFHMFQTFVSFLVELVVPFLILLRRPFPIWCGIVQISYQVMLIISGNSNNFQTLLVILLSIMCFDDKSLACLFSSSSSKREVAEIQNSQAGNTNTRGYFRQMLVLLPVVTIAYLSLPMVQNLLSSQQATNSSSSSSSLVDSYRDVQTHDPFTSILKERREVILQGTRNSTIIPDDRGGIWEEYQFKCKPGDTKRRPCLFSPYHYKLDWRMAFAAYENYHSNPWLINLAAKLLTNNEDTVSLMAYNPFNNGTLPKFIRGEHYLYKFSGLGSQEAREGHWWTRTRLGSYFPPFTLKGIHSYIGYHGWELPKVLEKVPYETLNEIEPS